MSDESSNSEEYVAMKKADVTALTKQLKSQNKEVKKLRETLTQSTSRNAGTASRVKAISNVLATKFGLQQLLLEDDSDNEVEEETAPHVSIESEAATTVDSDVPPRGSRTPKSGPGGAASDAAGVLAVETKQKKASKSTKCNVGDTPEEPPTKKPKKARKHKEDGKPKFKHTPPTAKQVTKIGDQSGYVVTFNLYKGETMIAIDVEEVKNEVENEIGMPVTAANLQTIWTSVDHETLADVAKNVASLILIQNLDDLYNDPTVWVVYLDGDIFPIPGERNEAEYVRSMPEPVRSALMCVTDILLDGVVVDENDRLELLQKVVANAKSYVDQLRRGFPVYTGVA